MKMTAEYTNLADLKTFMGIDLPAELAVGQDPNIFLRECEDRIIDYINHQSWRHFDNEWWQIMSIDQQEAFQKAVYYQVKYELYNGDLMNDSGIDPERGRTLGTEELEKASIAPRAVKTLKDYGLVTLVMRGRW